MDDVSTMKSETANQRKITSMLVQWVVKDNPLAPLTQTQQDTLDLISQLVSGEETDCVDKSKDRSEDAETWLNEEMSTSRSLHQLQTTKHEIESTQEFLTWYNKIGNEIYERTDQKYMDYVEQLRHRSKLCDSLLEQIDESLNCLNVLNNEYKFVANKTDSLNTASEQLIQEQKQLNQLTDDLGHRLQYFSQADVLLQRLLSPTISVTSDVFLNTLTKINECITFLKEKPNFKESSAYMVKYRHCLQKATQMMRTYVNQIITTAAQQILVPRDQPKPAVQSSELKLSSADTVFALFYGKFQSYASKVKRITSVIEANRDHSPEYIQLLNDLHQFYFQHRAMIMSPGVTSAIKNLADSHKGDHCALVRSACAFLVHVCQDEHRLFFQFFESPSSQLSSYLDGICTILYDMLRPYIIHINHLETLAEICSILRVEMLEEHVQQFPDALESFGRIIHQLLQDVQERLVFRAHLYLESDILKYKPSAGDLAYPEKLEMMESIALSLQEQQVSRRPDSRNSVYSMVSSASQETEHQAKAKARLANSPADLHGMWYPTVRRTLVCLSRLYRCIDRPIFQGLSQQALTHCVESVSVAAQQITEKKKSPIDGELFEIKHLLILREQIAPFRVDFTVKETTLDFSKVKTAAYGLLQKRKQLFSLSSNNAFLEFLQEGAPQLKEHLHDSRKEVDRQLKSVCEQFIRDATRSLIGPITNFIDQVSQFMKSQTTSESQGTSDNVKTGFTLRQSAWAKPQQIAGLVQEAQRNLKQKLAGLQRSMQLYLSNKDTEFILFRPIRNNIISAFVKLDQILITNHYSREDLVIVSCPSPDQISLLISSASLSNADTITEGPTRKLSSSSNETNQSVSRKHSVEKKVSFDSNPIHIEEPSDLAESPDNLNKTESDPN